MSPAIITVTIILTLTTDNFTCFGQLAQGCWEQDTNHITINTSLEGEEFKETLLHEIAHAKYDKQDRSMFKMWPARTSGNSLIEKAADWFVVFWKNISFVPLNSPLRKFYGSEISYGTLDIK